MEHQQKESYTEPVVTTHELLRDITGNKYVETKGGIEKSGVESVT
jgi:hypothetical protein